MHINGGEEFTWEVAGEMVKLDIVEKKSVVLMRNLELYVYETKCGIFCGDDEDKRVECLMQDWWLHSATYFDMSSAQYY